MPVRTTTFQTSDVLTANDLNALAGAWNAYTPTLAQGASSNIAKTVTYAKYLQFGKLVICQLNIAATAAGTSGSPFTLTLPVTAAVAAGVVGSGGMNDTGYGYRPGLAFLASVTTVKLVRTDTDSFTALGLGQDPAFALASGDSIHIAVMYEAA